MNATSASKKKNKLFVEADTAWEKGDLRRAFELFLRAAELGDRASQLNVGYFYDRGFQVKRNEKEAMHWYYNAYRQDDQGAANNIATVHRDNGRMGKMIWWFRRAVAMGDHDALVELGKFYETGFGVAKNLARAADCYRRVLASTNVTQFSQEQAAKRLAKLRKLEEHSV